jgi:hypothetical protein
VPAVAPTGAKEGCAVAPTGAKEGCAVALATLATCLPADRKRRRAVPYLPVHRERIKGKTVLLDC